MRDTSGSYWLHDLEEVDLFQVSIESGFKHIETGSQGRTGGMTLPIIGLPAGIEAKLRVRLASREQVVVWRLLQLDAKDAFSLGKYEETVLLAGPRYRNWLALQEFQWLD